jgi:hypothetical protein
VTLCDSAADVPFTVVGVPAEPTPVKLMLLADIYADADGVATTVDDPPLTLEILK